MPVYAPHRNFDLADILVRGVEMFAQIADTFEPGTTVYIPVQQDCSEGSHSWSEIPAPGQDAHALKAAAPSFRIVQAAQTGSVATAPAAPVKAGDLTIETADLRVQPDDEPRSGEGHRTGGDSDTAGAAAHGSAASTPPERSPNT